MKHGLIFSVTWLLACSFSGLSTQAETFPCRHCREMSRFWIPGRLSWFSVRDVRDGTRTKNAWRRNAMISPSRRRRWGTTSFNWRSGYLYLYKDEGGEIEHSHVTPETLLRFGLSDDIEFRVRWNYAWQYFEEEHHKDSAMDMIWSIKLQMTEQCGWVPESALEIRSSVPTGGSDVYPGPRRGRIRLYLRVGTQ